MRLLILGGSWFVGRAIVEQAVLGRHEVSVFNRGRTPASYPGTVRVLHGDRERGEDLERLAGQGPWDAVIDVAGSVPAVVRDAARALSPAAGRYVFVSTISVYRDWLDEPIDEGSALHPGDPDQDPGTRAWDPASYGPLKAGCEQAIGRSYPADRTLIVRPGVVLGPGEYVGRLPWWLHRMHRAGRVLAPGTPDRAIQPIDVRDLAAFLLSLTARGRSGVYNVTAPPDRDTYGDLLTSCARAVGTHPDLTWIDDDWLTRQDVRQWTELPLWLTATGTSTINPARAHAVGLTCRPLQDTVQDVWAWLTAGGTPVPHERAAEHGLAPDKEARLLRAWDTEHPTSRN